MSTRYYCNECRKPIPNGHAVIRSESFRTVARCGPCYGIRYLGHPTPTPPVGGSLRERLARKLVADRG
jgi:hypothetical protein